MATIKLSPTTRAVLARLPRQTPTEVAAQRTPKAPARSITERNVTAWMSRWMDNKPRGT